MIYIITMRSILDLFKSQKPCSSLDEFAKKQGFKTQKELARFLEISESHLSYHRSGKKPFGRKTLLRVSKLTGIPVENIIQ